MNKYLEKKYRCHHMTVYKNPDGDICIAHYAGSFGEPSQHIKISLDKPDGFFETSRCMSLDEAVQFGNEIIRRAKIAKKLLKRWEKAGIPADVPLDPQDVAENPYREGWFNGNERAKRLSDLWFSQKSTMTVEQGNEIGSAYISEVLGLGYKVTMRFSNGDRAACHEVGMKQAGVKMGEINVDGFWKKLNKIFPGVYTDEDIAFLVKEGGAGSVFHFLDQVTKSIPFNERSPILRAIGINAHVYK